MRSVGLIVAILSSFLVTSASATEGEVISRKCGIHHCVEIARENGGLDLIDRYLPPPPRAKGSGITLRGYELCISLLHMPPQGGTCEEFPLVRQRSGARTSRVDLMRAFGPLEPGRYGAEWIPTFRNPNGVVDPISAFLRFSIPRRAA